MSVLANKSAGCLRIVQLIYQDPGYHPPVHFSCQLLAELGHVVQLLARTPEAGMGVPGGYDLGPGSTLIAVGQGRAGLGDKIDYLRYVLAIRRALKNADLVIAYNFLAAGALALADPFGRVPVVYHNLDLIELDELHGASKFLKSKELAIARRAFFVMTSSPARTERFALAAGLSTLPSTVMNCQRAIALPPSTGELRKILAERGLRWNKIVARLGLMAPNNAIENTIRASKLWPPSCGLVLAGIPAPGFLEQIAALIISEGVQDRVLVLSAVPYPLWYDILQSADIGSALYEPHDFGNQSMAGAGNKLNLYLRAALPCLVPDIGDFRAFAAIYPVGPLVDSANVQAIADAVTAMLARDLSPERAAAADAVKRAFSFEHQYQPALNAIAAYFQRA